MSYMGECRALRRIGEPVVAAPPAAVRIRTRIRLSEAEAEALVAVGSFLGLVFRVELVGRARLGRLDPASQAWAACSVNAW